MNALKLPAEVNRFVFVRHLPFQITADQMYDVFGKYGAIRQIRLGTSAANTAGQAFVVYEDIFDAKNCVEHMNGFKVGGRYITVSYHKIDKFKQVLLEKRSLASKSKQLDELQKKYNVSDKMDTSK